MLESSNTAQNHEALAQQEYSDTVLRQLIHPSSPAEADAGEMAIFIKWKYPTGLPELLVDVVEQSPDEDTIRRVYPMFANRLGLETIRKYLREHATIDPTFEPILAKTDRILGFSTESHPKNTLQEVYQEIGIAFKDYLPNQTLNQREVVLLESTFSPNAHLLDLGCGPNARHMNQLNLDHRTVSGIDFVPENVNAALADHPELDIRCADWQQLPFPNNYFDGAYSLGRSLLHNTTIADWIVTLQEIWRVLNHNHPQGNPSTLIVDIPNAQAGDYRYEIQRFRKVAKKLGIHDYEQGYIHDSPDGVHFFDRFVPTRSQFELMATIGGFTATLIHQENYPSSQADPNQNQYWLLSANGYPRSYAQSVFDMRYLSTKPIATIDIGHWSGKQEMTWKKLAHNFHK